MQSLALQLAKVHVIKDSGTKNVHWSKACEKSLQKLKDHLCKEPVLFSPDFSRVHFTNRCLRSGTRCNIVPENKWRGTPCTIFELQTVPSGVGIYSIIEKEGFAMQWALDSL